MSGSAEQPVSQDRFSDVISSLRRRVSELEEENAELQRQVQTFEHLDEMIEVRGADSIDEASITDIWIAGVPVGVIIDKINVRSQDNVSRLDELEEHGVDASGQVSEDARQSMKPLHKMWSDVKVGDVNSVPSQDALRASHLFGRMLRKASGESSLGVRVARGAYLMDSTEARSILEEEANKADYDLFDVSEASKSKVVGRAMKEVVSLTKETDCDCIGVEACPHGLIELTNPGGFELRAEKDAFHNYCQEIEAAVTETFDLGDENVTSPVDDASATTDVESSDEAAENAAEPDVSEGFDRILAAERGDY